MNSRDQLLPGIAVLSQVLVAFTSTAPFVPCASVTRYATVTDSRTISFAPDGTLYVGSDNSGSAISD